MGTTENLGEQQSGGMVLWLGQNMQNHQDDIRESGNLFFLWLDDLQLLHFWYD